MDGTQGQQDRIIELFYRAILDPSHWSEALQRVAGLMHCESASIILYDRNSGQAALSHSFGTAEETPAAYHAYYCTCDPGPDAIRQVEVGDWYRLVVTHGVEGGLSLQRAIGRRPFDQTDMELASGIIPHLQRVMAIHMKLQAAAHREACLNCMIDSINFAMLSVDRQAKVLHLNAAAERLIQQHGVIDVTSGELAMAGIAPHCLLQMIARACGEPPQAGIEMLRDELGFPCMQLVVTPLAQEEAGGVSELGGPYALVVLKPLDAAGSVSEPLLHELYGLTPAESRLSVLLLQGASVREAAELACVSLNTVRTQLKSVFAKTGTRRQADLVRKLSLLSSLWH
jgi:DNA-binding CsgD family transcriptional regulator/PAS domain-containing protein